MNDSWTRKLNHLLTLADDLAEAKAHLANLDNVKKTVIAVAMKECGETSLGAQEREAYASESYRQWCRDHKVAVKAYEGIRLRVRVAETWFDMARTAESTKREEMRLAR